MSTPDRLAAWHVYIEQVDKRFEQVDRRCAEMIRPHDLHLLWLIGFISTGGTLIVTAVKLC